jgi:hypothetical protein
MVYVPDLSALGHPQLIAVGWLAKGETYARGPVTEPFVGALLGLLANPWQPVLSAGFHRCELCRISGGPSQMQWAGEMLSLGTTNLYVPFEGRIFVSPSLIAHYMDAHEYAPPEVFQTAVLQCPQMRSTGYLKAVLKNGPPGFSKNGGYTAW